MAGFVWVDLVIPVWDLTDVVACESGIVNCRCLVCLGERREAAVSSLLGCKGAPAFVDQGAGTGREEICCWTGLHLK
jgi:hypothetical protein